MGLCFIGKRDFSQFISEVLYRYHTHWYIAQLIEQSPNCKRKVMGLKGSTFFSKKVADLCELRRVAFCSMLKTGRAGSYL